MTIFRIGSIKQEKISENRVRCLLRKVRENDGISQLYFFHIEFSESVLKDVRKLLVRDGRQFSCIKFLSCTGNVRSAIETIMDHASTESLTISNCCPETLHVLNETLRTNQSLKVLKITGTTVLQGDDCVDGLVFNSVLQELDLCGSHLSECAVESLGRNLSKNRSLRVLKMDSCDLEDHSMATLIKSILDHPSIQELDVSNNTASNEALQTVASLILRNKIQKLSINSLHFSDDLHTTVLFQAMSTLCSNTSLCYLDISGNRLTNEAVTKLAECLTENMSLKHLDVSDTEIDAVGISTIASFLPRFHGLKVFNISENEISETAALHLVKGLENNRLIQSLGPIDDDAFECSKLIQHYLDLNMAGRRALQNDILLGVWPRVLERAALADLSCGRNENALFSLLRGPALFER